MALVESEYDGILTFHLPIRLDLEKGSSAVGTWQRGSAWTLYVYYVVITSLASPDRRGSIFVYM